MLYDINSSGTGRRRRVHRTRRSVPYALPQRRARPARRATNATPTAINESNVIVGNVGASRPSGAPPPPAASCLPCRGYGRCPASATSARKALIVGVGHKAVSGRGETRTVQLPVVPGRHLHRAAVPAGLEPTMEGGALPVSAANGSPATRLGPEQSAWPRADGGAWNLRTGKVRSACRELRASCSLNEHGWVGYSTRDKMAVRDPAGRGDLLPRRSRAAQGPLDLGGELVSDDGRDRRRAEVGKARDPDGRRALDLPWTGM